MEQSHLMARISKKGGTEFLSRYILWNELLRRTFGSEVVCNDCGVNFCLIALVKKDETISTILISLHMPTGPPKVVTAQLPFEDEEAEFSETGVGYEWAD